MKKNCFKKLLIVSLVVFCGLSCCLMKFVSAASKAIVMAPMSQKIILSPGETYRGGFITSNPLDADGDLPYAVSISPFYPVGLDKNDNDDYGGVDYETKTNMNQIVDWITIENPSGVIAPGEERTISFVIKVPEDAPAGGQYAAILVREDPEFLADNNSNVAVNEVMQMAHIVYANVAGETRKEGAILGNDIPSFSTDGVLKTSAMVRNNGNVHTDAEYILQVWPLSSDEEICTNEEESDKIMVLPNTQRYYSSECKLPMVGIFRAKQTVRIFGEESVVEKMIIVCPLWLLFIIFFAIVMVVAWLIARTRSRNGSRDGGDGSVNRRKIEVE